MYIDARPEPWSVEGGLKGFPSGLPPMSVEAIGSLGVNVLAQQVSFPTALLKISALEHNQQWMKSFLTQTGALLAPHGKTTMSPELIRLQLDNGAWAITAATSQHILAYADIGVRRILHANQLVGQENIRSVFSMLANDSSLDFYTLVDSHAGVEVLRQGLLRTPIGRPLQVLIELGAEGGRTGLRTVSEALGLAREIRADALFCLAGVECFEGIYSGRSEQDDVGAKRLIEGLGATAGAMRAEDLFDTEEPILSAGGSAYFAMAAGAFNLFPADSFRIVLRSGCYLTHDSHHYRIIHERLHLADSVESPSGGLRAALEVWGCVQSRPEPRLALIDIGKRDISYDIDLPVALWTCGRSQSAPASAPDGCRVTALNDQHLFLELPEQAELGVGDLVGFGVSHPCTTFDKWRALLLVDDDYIVRGAVHTCF